MSRAGARILLLALGAAVLAAVATQSIWFAVHQGGESPPLRASTSDEAALRALARVAESSDPFLTAVKSRQELLSDPRNVLDAAKRAWDRREFSFACAVIAALGGAAAPAAPWLASVAEEDHAEAEAAATLALWCIDKDVERAIDRLLDIHGRVADDGEQAIRSCLRRMNADGAEVVVGLVRELDDARWPGALRLLILLGPEAGAVVPQIERLVAALAIRWGDGEPVMGTHEVLSKLEALINVLPRFGSSGAESVVRLLYSQNSGVASLAGLSILDSPDHVTVTQVLRSIPREAAASVPSSVFEVLARAPATLAEWAATLEVVASASSDGKREFLHGVNEKSFARYKIDPLVEALLLWTIDDPELAAIRLEVLDELAPDDERVRALRASGGR